MRQSLRPLARPDERLQPLIRSLRLRHNRPINKQQNSEWNALPRLLPVIVARVSSPIAVEEIIGLVRHKSLGADVRRAAAAFRGRGSSHGIHSLNEGGPSQLGAACWSRLRSDHLYKEPGNCPRSDEDWVRRGSDHLSPDGTCVSGVLPSGAYDVAFERVGAEEVGGNLLFSVVEQRGLWGKQCEGEAGSAVRPALVARQANVVLCADAVSHEEYLVLRRNSNFGGHEWRYDCRRGLSPG